MPIVPGSTTPQVRPSPAGTPFQQVSGVSAAAFGGLQGEGLSRAGRDVRSAADQIAQLALKQQIEDNERKAKELDIEFSKRRRQLLFGDGTPDNPGYYNLRGGDAVDRAPEVEAQLNDIRTEILEQTDNPRVQEMFGNSSATKIESELNRVGRFVIGQRQAANEATSVARIAEAQDDAALGYNSKEVVIESEAIIRSEIFSRSETQGWSAEVTENELDKAISGMYRAMVMAAIQDRDLATAQKIMDENAHKIDPAIMADLENLMQEPKLLADAQVATDQIMVTFDNEKEALQFVRTEFSGQPELRDKVTSLVQKRFADERRFRDEQIDQITADITEHLYTGQGTFEEWIVQNPEEFRLLASDDAAFTVVQNAAATVNDGRIYAERSDPKIVEALVQSQEQGPEALSRWDLSTLRGSLDEQDFNRWANLVTAARNRLNTEHENNSAYRRAEGIVGQLEDAFPSLETTKPQRKRSDRALAAKKRVLMELYTFVDEFKQSEGRFPNTTEIANEFHRLMTPVEVEVDDVFELLWRGVFGTDTDFESYADALNELSQEELNELRVDIDDASPEIVELVRQEFIDAGQENPTDDQIEEYMGAILTRDVDRMERLLKQPGTGTGGTTSFSPFSDITGGAENLNISKPVTSHVGDRIPPEQETPPDIRFVPEPGSDRALILPAETPIEFSEDVPEEVQPALTEAVRVSGVDAETLSTIARAESNFDPDAKNPNSSASGLFQFTNRTWKAMVNRHGEEHGITLDDRFDPRANAIMGGLLTKQNKEIIEAQVGREPTLQEIYLAHFAGIGTALKIIEKIEAGEGDAPASDVFSQREIDANPGIIEGTIEETFNRLTSKVS